MLRMSHWNSPNAENWICIDTSKQGRYAEVVVIGWFDGTITNGSLSPVRGEQTLYTHMHTHSHTYCIYSMCAC